MCLSAKRRSDAMRAAWHEEQMRRRAEEAWTYMNSVDWVTRHYYLLLLFQENPELGFRMCSIFSPCKLYGGLYTGVAANPSRPIVLKCAKNAGTHTIKTITKRAT